MECPVQLTPPRCALFQRDTSIILGCLWGIRSEHYTLSKTTFDLEIFFKNLMYHIPQIKYYFFEAQQIVKSIQVAQEKQN